jgi:capsular polysaccharide biosynthesis protein
MGFGSYLMYSINGARISNSEDEMEFIDIYRFLKRRYLLILKVFIFSFLLLLLFAVTRPTLYESKVNLLIGENYFFINQASSQRIESPEELTHKYSSKATIKPIKNTRIVELSVATSNREESINKISLLIDLIVNEHKRVLEDKEQKFKALINNLVWNQQSKLELLRVIDNASNSSSTKAISDIITEEKKYGGIFNKLIGIGFFGCLIFSLIIAIIGDYFENKMLNPREF